MRARCVGSTGEDLPADFLEKSGNTPHSRFNISVGSEYLVHAMALWDYGIGLLVVDDNLRPNWKPIGLFEITDHSLPSNWKFRVVGDKGPVLALWGYRSLIENPEHHDGLIERKTSALEEFCRDTGWKPGTSGKVA